MEDFSKSMEQSRKSFEEQMAHSRSEFQKQMLAMPQQIAQLIAAEMQKLQQQTAPRINPTEFERKLTAETEFERKSNHETESQEQMEQRIAQAITSQMQKSQQQTAPRANPAEFEKRLTAETGNNNFSKNLKCDLKLEFPKFEVSTTIAPEMFDESPKKEKLEVVIESELKDKIGEKNDKFVYEVVGEVYEVHDIGLEVALDAVSHLVETGEEVVDRYDLYCGSDRLLAQLILKTGVVVNHHTTELGEVASSTGPWIKLVRLELHNIEATNISEMDTLIFDPGGADSIPNLHSIIAASDGAMVARGDLGAELPVVEVPLLQVEIIRWWRSMGKDVIVATNMLESMIFHPTPNRVEVLDIAIAGFSVITPANIQQILVVLLESLGNALHISEKVSGAIYYLARGYEDADTSSSMLTPHLFNVIKCLLETADRTDGSGSKLRSAAYETLNEVVRCSNLAVCAQIIAQLLPVIMLLANSDPKLVIKGITHGACDYLVPVQVEELRNIGQHVVRKRVDHVIKYDQASWNSMLIEYATNGYGYEALNLFAKMRCCGFVPTETTFTAVLFVCDYGRLVEEDHIWFHTMKYETRFFCDDGDIVIIIGDWYTRDHEVLRGDLDSGMELGMPDGVLFNGNNVKLPTLVLLKKEAEKVNHYDGPFIKSALAEFVFANKLCLDCAMGLLFAPVLCLTCPARRTWELLKLEDKFC